MKTILKYIAVATLAIGTLSSCEAVFDNLEGDLTKMQAEDMFKNEAGIKRVLADIYNYIPMDAFDANDRSTFFANHSRETASYSNNGVSSFWNYTQMRSINLFMDNIKDAAERGVITEEAANTYLGEATFIRAYCYFAGVRVYGGMPIVDRVLDDEYKGDGVNAGLYIPRSTEKDTWDWILAQLDEAAALLPETAPEEMRVSKYTAYALKARVALWAASESKYWNRAQLDPSYQAVQQKLTYMEESYANNYYQTAIDAAYKVINSGRYGLEGANPSTIQDATTNLINLFQNYSTLEGLLGKSYKSGNLTSGNGMESSQGGNWGAPAQVAAGWRTGVYSYTLNYADEFDYYDTDRSSLDGTIPTKIDGDETTYFRNDTPTEFQKNDNDKYIKYDNVSDPFVDKDARFQAWIVYPGATFRNTVIVFQGGMIMPDGTPNIYPVTNDGVEFNGTVYYPYGGEAEQNSGFYELPGNINNNNRTAYCFHNKKYLDQTAYNTVTQTPWYDLRYSEVLLTYAEACVESGLGDAALAKDCLNEVRHRAGFTDDVDLTLDNVLHEWKVEFAAENKWQSVLWRRRAFYNGQTPYDGEGVVNEKLTLIPLVDLSGSEAKYIFLRSLTSFDEVSQNPSGFHPQVRPEDYYSAIPNYSNNHLINNNTK